MNYVNDFFSGFNQLTQLVFGFALGLAFSQSNITVGWIFFWIVVWEFGVYLLLSRTKYYDPFFRIAYNCVFLLSILVGQYIYFGKTTFQDFLYSNYPETKKAFSGEKYQIMEKFEKMLDDVINGEEKSEKRKKLARRYKLLHMF
jgi:hypothetical protein